MASTRPPRTHRLQAAVLGSLVVLVGLTPAAPGASAPPPSPVPGAVSPEPQARSSAPSATFRAGVDLVTLDVWVQGRDARFVQNLTATDFLVLEDGHPQELSLFVPEGGVPLAVLLLVDRSGSMLGPKLDNARVAAAKFIEGLAPRDSVGVMAFDTSVERLAAIGGDHMAAIQAVAGLEAGGQTALYEALAVGLHELETTHPGGPEGPRRVLVVLSDGEDTRSVVSFEDVVERVRKSDMLVYGISLRTGSEGRVAAPAFSLLELAYLSGGRAVAATDPTRLTSLYRDIGVELRSLYRLGYTSSNSTLNGAWRSVSIRVTHPGTTARSRAGYYAPHVRSRRLRKPRPALVSLDATSR